MPVRTGKDLELAKKYYPYVEYIFLDGAKPGSGKSFNYNLLENFDLPFFVSGGINTENLEEALKTSPVGIDMATGVERDGRIDINKIKLILNQLKQC